MNYFKEKVAAGLETLRKTSWPAGEMLPAYAFLFLLLFAVLLIGVVDAVGKRHVS